MAKKSASKSKTEITGTGRGKRYPEAFKLAVLRDAAKMTAKETAEKHSISVWTIHAWKKAMNKGRTIRRTRTVSGSPELRQGGKFRSLIREIVREEVNHAFEVQMAS